MLRDLHLKMRNIVTPLSGLALGIASLGWSLENAIPLHGLGQNCGAIIAAILLLFLAGRYIFHFDTLINDLKHPVAGSIVPTFAMAWMVVSSAIGNYHALAGQVIWLLAVIFHLTVLIIFVYYRVTSFNMHHMIPSWFIPPVGIIVATVTTPGGIFNQLALLLLIIGMTSYFIMLPLMIYRFIFCSEIPDSSKPTIAIMAAPASLSLAGYLTVTPEPSLLLCALLFGIAILMTITIYCAFFKLLKLPFTPGFAAFTFPLAIGATALYKLSNLLNQYALAQEYARQLYWLATFEVIVATLIITYVALHYLYYYLKHSKCFMWLLWIKPKQENI